MCHCCTPCEIVSLSNSSLTFECFTRPDLHIVIRLRSAPRSSSDEGHTTVHPFLGRTSSSHLIFGMCTSLRSSLSFSSDTARASGPWRVSLSHRLLHGNSSHLRALAVRALKVHVPCNSAPAAARSAHRGIQISARQGQRQVEFKFHASWLCLVELREHGAVNTKCASLRIHSGGVFDNSRRGFP